MSLVEMFLFSRFLKNLMLHSEALSCLQFFTSLLTTGFTLPTESGFMAAIVKFSDGSKDPRSVVRVFIITIVKKE